MGLLVLVLLLVVLAAVAAAVWFLLLPALGGGSTKPGGGSTKPGATVPSDWNGKTASTTQFSFGGSTACVCNGQKVTQDLLPLGWVGCATPDWMLTPFLDMKGAVANSKDTPATVKNQKYYSNCGIGPGGCATCWELTTTGEANIYGDKSVPAGIKMNAVVVDACEDRNAYGNNTQWCLAASGVPEGGIVQNEVGAAAQYLRPGVFTDEGGKTMRWSNKDCVKDGKWVCTNLAGRPAHFDIAMASLTPAQIKQLKGWPQGSNPIVKIKKVQCPKAVTDALRKNCGDNAKPGEGECFWCPQNPAVQQGAEGSLPSQIPSWWGGCDKEDQKPECAPMYTHCGGADGTPTCCQWPKYFECKADKSGYKLCSKKA